MMKVSCDWCNGGFDMTDCGEEACDHCGGTAKVNYNKTALCHYSNISEEVDEMRGIKIIIPTWIKILLGFRLLELKRYEDLPMVVIQEVLIH